MCRLAAFPPGTPADVALEIVNDFEGHNKDGFGYGFLKGNYFVAKKFPMSFSDTLKSGARIFDHMPHKGWTVAHVRMKTHGIVKEENTHPFIRGNYMTAHNGVWSAADTARPWLSMFVKFKGETDSEVASYLIHRMTPKGWWNTIYSGVYLSLQRNGSLHIAKGLGDAEFFRSKCGPFIASEFPKGWKSHKFSDNCYHSYDKNGKLVEAEEKKYSYGGGSSNSSHIGMERQGRDRHDGKCGGIKGRNSLFCAQDYPEDDDNKTIAAVTSREFKDYIEKKIENREYNPQPGLWEMRD